MSLTFKLLSLAIRTAAKPIGNYIKRQAKEHDGFRRFAVRQAQRVHRIDMRMRLGILHDSEAQERMHERERKREEEKKRRSESPTVRTEEEQKKFEEEQAKEAAGEKKAEKPKPPVIRPLSEAKAIDLGANFFSESFIFAVAAGLLVWDAWRSRRKESARRDDVRERIDTLEFEVDRLRLKYEPHLEPLSDPTEPEPEYGWYNPRSWWTRTNPPASRGEEDAKADPAVSRGREEAKAVEASVTAPTKSALKPVAAVPSSADSIAKITKHKANDDKDQNGSTHDD